MSKANMDYLWAPKDEKVVSGLLNHLGFEGVGESKRYPTGVKYDTMIAISDVLMNEDKFASMVASRTNELQADRGSKRKGVSIDSVVNSLRNGKITEADLKAAMKAAGLIK